MQMPNTMNNHFDKARLQEIADLHHIDLIVLFGSYVKGKVNPDDIDIAIRISQDESVKILSSKKVRWQYEMNLIAALDAITDLPYDIDLMILNDVFDSTFLFEVARYGEVVYQREPTTFNQFRAYAARCFDDDAKFRQWGWEYLKRRCLDAK